ncbi:hypothetical protein TKK_0004634 [Trichogramma kaykai]
MNSHDLCPRAWVQKKNYLIAIWCNSVLNIYFVFFLHTHRHCTTDYIAVYAGPTVNSALLKTFCGKQKGSVTHVGKDLLVEFRSGPEVAPFDYNGFVASLNMIEITTEAPTTTTPTPETTSKAVELMRTPVSTYDGNNNHTRNSLRAKTYAPPSTSSGGGNCDVEVSSEPHRSGSHSTRGRALAPTCRLTLIGREYDTVLVVIAKYNLSVPDCVSQIEVFDGLVDKKTAASAKPIGKICSLEPHLKHSSSHEHVEKKKYSSSSRNLTILLTKGSDYDFMDVSYSFRNDFVTERETSTQQAKTYCDVEYYGRSSPKAGMVLHPKMDRFSSESGNVKCKQHFIPAANQAVIITLNSTMNQTSESRCTTLCGDQGCRCASDEALDNIDHLLLVSQNLGNVLACLCGNNRDWLPVEFWSTSPVYIEWSRSSHTGWNLTAEYKFAEDNLCGAHEAALDRLEGGDILAGHSANFSFALNHYYQQKCTYIIDSPPQRELIITIESNQTRPCSAWNLTIHEYNKTSPNPEGPRLHTFCPRDISRNFTIEPELRSVIVKLQALGRTAPRYTLRWRSHTANSTRRGKNLAGLSNNIALASASSSRIISCCHLIIFAILFANFARTMVIF